jgi:hypothetical protein
MEPILPNAFSPLSASQGTTLDVARNLARIYADVLEEPLPPDLQGLIIKLSQRDEQQAPMER